MFKGLFKKEKVASTVADKVASHIVEELQSPYIYEYIGNIKFKIEKEPSLSDEKVAVFKKAVLRTLDELLFFSGYARIKGDEQLMVELFEECGIEYPEDRLAGDIWYIEDNKDAYFYAEGMKRAKRI
ncbi:MAG: hypothetical protein IKJ43_01090 [Bacilli bacterium]|nr:hypothetical protein [Bacilli bacterium]